MQSKSRILREALERRPAVRIIGAHNAIGAKLAQRHGFDGVWASGLEISTAHAVPDANILTMTDFFEAACVMNGATSLPVVCDCDTGYGNAANVQHLVRKYEAAGLAAVVIEDKVFPKVNSFVPGRQELAPVDEFMGKIQAAKDAQVTEDFMVIARVEALIAGWGLQEALRRAYAYVEAGADGIVIHSKAKSPDEIYQFAAAWKAKVPLVAIPTTYAGVTADELAARGFRMVIFANQGLRASIKAMDDTFAAIARDGSAAAVEPKICSLREVFDLQGMPAMQENERKYARASVAEAVVLAAGDHRRQPGLGDQLKDMPLCMVDVAGKPLLARQADALRSCGITDIRVVGGFLSEKISVEGVRVIANPDYRSTGIAYSMLLGRQDPREPSLMAYGDVVHDRRIVEHLLKSPYPLTVVIDRAYQALPAREKALDLVFAESIEKPAGGRHLELNAFKKIVRIGAGLSPAKANYEFAGLALFRPGMMDRVRALWDEAKAEFRGRPFYGAPGVEQADLNDLFQYLIDRGVPVHGLEVEKGWSEIHSLADLERVRSYFAAEPRRE